MPEATLFEDEAPDLWTNQIHLDLLTPSDELNATLDNGMVESLRRFGMLCPVGVHDRKSAPGPPSPYRVLDGARRIIAARHLGTVLDQETMERLRLDPVSVVFVPRNYSSTEALTLIANYQRSPNPIRDFLALETALKRPGATPRKIARELGLDERDLGRLAKLLSLNEILRQAFIDGEIAPGIASRIAKMSQDRQTRICTYRLQKLSELPEGKSLVLTGKEIERLFKRDAQAAIASLGDEVFAPGNASNPAPFDFTAEVPPSEARGWKAEAAGWKTEAEILKAELSGLQLELHNAITNQDHWVMCAAARLKTIDELHNSLKNAEEKSAEIKTMALGMVAGIAKELRKKADAKYMKQDMVGAMLQAASSLEHLK